MCVVMDRYVSTGSPLSSSAQPFIHFTRVLFEPLLTTRICVRVPAPRGFSGAGEAGKGASNELQGESSYGAGMATSPS